MSVAKEGNTDVSLQLLPCTRTTVLARQTEQACHLCDIILVCAALQAVFSEQLQAALQQTSSSLQATEQMRQESGGLAEQQAQQNEQLQAQVEQVRAQRVAVAAAAASQRLCDVKPPQQ